MAKGLTNKEIGGVLEISPGTAKVHVAAVIRALDVTNRTEATTRLHELGLGAKHDEVREDFNVSGFGNRRAIAVLPFDNFSSDREQDFLADGIVEDLTTSLANWRWFPVIARNSTFAYKDKAIDVQAVSRALGAGFIVEGSVRRTGDRVRITVQVLDGATATHVWAERYDCELANVFDITDEIVASIVASLEPALLRIEGLRVLSHRPDQLDAWQSLQRAYVHSGQNSLAGLLEAQTCLDRATELDPELSIAWAVSSFCQFHLYQFGHHDDTADPITLLDRAVDKLVELDATDPFTPLAIGMSRLARGDQKGALSAMQRAVELGPSMTFAVWGIAIAEGANGNPEQALLWLDRVFRLCPEDPILAAAHLNRGGYLTALGRIEEAEAAFERGRQLGPELPHAYPFLALLHALRGEHAEAQRLIQKMKAIAPGYSPLLTMRVFAPPESHDGLESALAKAGIL